MRSYEPSTPRVPLAFAALAMTALSLGALIALPAEMDGLDEDGLWAASRVVTMASAAVHGIASGGEAAQPASPALKCTDDPPKSSPG